MEPETKRNAGPPLNHHGTHGDIGNCRHKGPRQRSEADMRTAKCLEGYGVHDQKLRDTNKEELEPFFAKFLSEGKTPGAF